MRRGLVINPLRHKEGGGELHEFVLQYRFHKEGNS